jgi:hypothetical protein
VVERTRLKRGDPFSGHPIGRGFRSFRSFRKRYANRHRVGVPAQRGAEVAGNSRNFRNFRKRYANRHRVGIPAQRGLAAAGMVDRGVANMVS